MRLFLLAGMAFLSIPFSAGAATASSVTQYGVTWTFDKPYPVGQFVTGDWWVVGPVTVVSVSPAPGPGPATEPATDAKSRYGAVSLVDDKRQRNGSMIVLGPDKEGTFTKQGYDSRATNYDPAQSVAFPCHLPANQSLISTISSEAYKDGKLATPYVAAAMFPEQLKGLAGPAEGTLALDTAAVLTCLDKAPPADAFRPPYAGTNKTIYETKDIQWDLLPSLKPVGPAPDWDKMIRIYQRPWLDHIYSWTIQYSAPGQNQAAYGGVVTYMNSYASLMMLLDGPKEQKQKLVVEFLQYGIDLHGLAGCGRQWFSDGGHWMGRKWPILFASILLNKPEIGAFPKVDPKFPMLYGKYQIAPNAGGAMPTTLFSEDIDTYYGKGATGQNVLWQVGFHTHARQPLMERPFSEWSDEDKFVDSYFWTGGNWPGFALAALYLKARSTWNHDAFFDYCDWFMQPTSLKYYKDGHTGPARNNSDKFVQAMWDAYRKGAPEQAHGADNLKWIWTDGKMSADGLHFSATTGRFEPNPKGP